MKSTKFIDTMLSIVPIPKEDAVYISDQFKPFDVKKGDLLLQIGQISDEYLFIEEGLLRAYLIDLEGNEVTTDFYTEQNFAFEVTSFFNRTPSETNIEAITDCKGYKINFQQLNQAFHHKPSFRELGRAILVKAFIASKKRNYAMINQTAEQRYQHLISKTPQILKQAPLKQIASYLGVTDSTLSRIRAKLQ